MKKKKKQKKVGRQKQLNKKYATIKEQQKEPEISTAFLFISIQLLVDTFSAQCSHILTMLKVNLLPPATCFKFVVNVKNFQNLQEENKQ